MYTSSNSTHSTSSRPFFKTLEKFEEDLTGAHALDGGVPVNFVTRIKQLKDLEAEAKKCQVDHILITLYRLMMCSLKLSFTARHGRDANLAMITPNKANTSRTSKNAIFREDPFSTNVDIVVRIFQLETRSFTHSVFLTDLITTTDINSETQAEEINTTYYCGTVSILLSTIIPWLNKNGIPQEISLPVVELVDNIERTGTAINALMDNRELIGLHGDSQKLNTACENKYKDIKDRIEALLHQKNTLQRLVVLIATDKEATKYKEFIETKMKRLKDIIEAAQMQENGSLKDFFDYVKIKHGKDFHEKLEELIIVTGKNVFPDLTFANFTELAASLQANTNRLSVIWTELELVSEKYKLNYLEDT